VIGRIVHLNLEPYEVIGVLPADFHLPIEAGTANVWIPLRLSPDEIKNGGPNLTVIGRIKAGSALDQAQAEAEVVTANLRQIPIGLSESERLRVKPLTRHVGSTTRALWIMLSAAAGFVLLIACANVSNLALARALSRRREIAIRLAVGSSRRRILRQLLTESLLLAVPGGLGGLLLAWWSVQVLSGRAFDAVPFDYRVLGFTTGTLILAAVICGLFPAVWAARTDVNSSLKDGGALGSQGVGSFRLRQGFVVVQLALSLALLLGAGLMIRSLVSVFLIEPGFAKDGILSVNVYLPTERYTNGASRVNFFERTVEELAQLPGVRQAGATSSFPIHAPIFSREFTIGESHVNEGKKTYANINRVTDGYLAMMHIPLRRGRHFSNDREGTPEVAIIDETMQARFFQGMDPLGKMLTLDTDSGTRTTFTIVGVAARVINVGSRSDLERPRPIVYVPYRQFPPTSMTLLARVDGNAGALAPALRELLRGADPDLPIRDIRTVAQRIAQVAQRNYTVLGVLGVFAACGLGLAAVGIFGVVAFTVARRTREIGIRMALGARPRDVRNLFLGQGVKLAGIGTITGLTGAWVLTRGMERLLYGVSPMDPVTYVITPLFVLGIALGACWLPARRATRIDPMAALRYE
jgi:putative ABC transport system permease protein